MTVAHPHPSQLKQPTVASGWPGSPRRAQPPWAENRWVGQGVQWSPEVQRLAQITWQARVRARSRNQAASLLTLSLRCQNCSLSPRPRVWVNKALCRGDLSGGRSPVAKPPLCRAAIWPLATSEGTFPRVEHHHRCPEAETCFGGMSPLASLRKKKVTFGPKPLSAPY